MNYYLAIDIGASSGRHIIGYKQDGKMVLEEVYRFENGMKKKNQHLCWDLPYLFEQIIQGMRRCKEIGKVPTCVGIDTWGVDFVLLDEQDQIIGDTVGYRDSRTNGMDIEVSHYITEDKLYERTGIQKQIFNTIYQLMALKEQNQEQLNQAKTLLMVPDYLHFLLSGVKKTEYTIASTSQLLNPHTKDWDMDLIHLLGFPSSIFMDIVPPGTVLGDLTPEIEKQVGYTCKVVMPASHDTGSAVAAVPMKEKPALYISSGTWSLLGTEQFKADCSKVSCEHNFTNEGGIEYRFRYLKNIMGLWMIQSAKKEFEHSYTYAQLCEMAAKESITSVVDCNDLRFMAPESMTQEIIQYCKETNQTVPVGEAQISAVIYNSLASYYQKTVKELEDITGIEYDCIHIVGGGANADYLNQLTASKTQKIVLAGPVEATAIGNITALMLSQKEFTDLMDARKCIAKSFEIKRYM